MNTTIKLLLKTRLLVLLILLTNCIEEFVPEDLFFENLLVVEATITNEFKTHSIKLSRTFEFDNSPIAENGAVVEIIDELNNVYNFVEDKDGIYLSATRFAIQPNIDYTLNIATQDNAFYQSSPVALPSTSSEIIEISVSNSTSLDGQTGVEILVDSFDPTGSSKYYRYQYEETYRIIPPFWSPFEIVIVSDVPPFEVTTRFREEEERVCFNTTLSTEIFQTQTNDLSEDRVTKFPLKFIPSNSSSIRDRYSILVKQYVQSLEAYNYLNTLNEFSNSESVFSENQPGFLEGNIFSTSDENEKIIGFFELASVTSKRIFFNFNEVFPNDNRPPYFAECPTEFEKPLLTDPDNPNISPLINLVRNGAIEHFEDNTDFFGNLIENEPYFVTTRKCGDCTLFGTNIKPEFWID